MIGSVTVDAHCSLSGWKSIVLKELETTEVRPNVRGETLIYEISP